MVKSGLEMKVLGERLIFASGGSSEKSFEKFRNFALIKLGNPGKFCLT